MAEIPTVALGTDIHPSAQANFEAAGYRVVDIEPAMDELQVSNLLRGESAEFAGTRSRPPISGTIIKENPQLNGIGRFGKGLDGIDLEAADEAGIAIFISPRGNLDSVAEMVMGGIYSMSRNLALNDRLMRTGGWPKGSKGNHQIKGKTLGGIGMGGVGPIIAELARGNLMEAVSYDVDPDAKSEFATPLDSVEELLEVSDFVTVNVPLVPATRGLIGTAELARMKPGSYIINTARGELIDLNALDDALRRGHLAGAFLDVFNKEVEVEAVRTGFDVPLIDLETVIFSPHNGGNTEDSQAAMGDEVSAKYIRHRRTASTDEAINMPTAISGDPKPGVTRIFYAHTDEPGALRGVADVLDGAGLNIGPERNAQFEDDPGNRLSVATFDITRGEVTAGVIEAIRELPLTRRVWATPSLK